MNKSKALRVGGFIAAIAASSALVAAASGATGAYFTDSHPGAINASTGLVKVNVFPMDLQLNFNGLLPGEFQTQTVSYQNVGTGAEDIWLVLPTGGAADALNGVPRPGPAPLGRYGHFAVSAPDGAFTSFNLASPGLTDTTSVPCTVDAYGRGGSAQQAADHTDFIPYCPVPNAILLSWNVPANAPQQTADITFGFTKLLTGPQNAGPLLVSPFKIVATQHGVFPNDPNN
jgi:hypothetical protein